ncbi:hypothetical protein B5F53_10475 [Blautia sp. An249]|uniref:fibronectin type III domain-containing protein n=1 Tax=Blautia sp. An249 TaxID=1965603 RepID=UPI000B38C715|nr:hypothetical protein [Blautia sp. An249]OUO78353.1 hypothetical protein B5F53_10475 [Blautia sp. An249]
MRKKWMALGLAGLLAVSMPVTSLASALTLSEQECLEEETVSELTEEEEIAEEAEEISGNSQEDDQVTDDVEISDTCEEGEPAAQLYQEEESLVQSRNTMGTAQSISFGKKVIGSISESQSKKYYLFTLPSSGKININAFIQITHNYLSNVRILDSSGEELWNQSTYSYSSDGSCVINDAVDLTKGSYYFLVDGSGHDSGSYNFTLNFTSAGESLTETGYGNNNTMATADAVSLGTTYKGQLAENDHADYYRFTLPSSGKLNVHIVTEISRMYVTYFNIIDSQGKSIWDSNPYLEITNESLDLTKGTYYFYVENGYDTGNYQFKLAFTSANESFSESGDGNNNSMQTADAINLNVVYRGQIARNDRKDFYKFTLTNTSSVRFSATSWLDNVTYGVYNEAGQEIWSDGFHLKDDKTGTNYSYKNLSLKAGTYYLYVGEGTYTGNYSIKVAVNVPTVTLKRVAAVDAHSIQVTWNQATGATGYRVYRKTASTGWTGIGDTTATSYTDTNAVPGQYYYYTVKAYVGSALSSSYKSSVKICTTIGTPTLTGLTKTANSGLKLSWNKVAGASGYYVYRKVPGGSWTKLKGQTAATYTDTSVQVGTTYAYTVRAAVNMGGKQYLSGYNKTGLSGSPDLATPKLTSLAKTGSNTLRLTWEKVPQASGYYVYRKVPGGSWTKLKGQTATTYTDTTVKAGTTYTYTVRAALNKGSKQYLSSYDKTGLSAKP